MLLLIWFGHAQWTGLMYALTRILHEHEREVRVTRMSRVSKLKNPTKENYMGTRKKISTGCRSLATAKILIAFYNKVIK